jgi:hypothetical protein
LEARTAARGAPRLPQVWWGRDRDRILFDVALPGTGFRARNIRGYGREYTGVVEVPHYGAHRVRIVFRNKTPDIARVYVDRPEPSPHRFDDHSLCMWFPWHPRSQRWVRNDGLLCLLGYIGAHLFREHWWHETGEWLGPEVRHAVTPKRETDADAA